MLASLHLAIGLLALLAVVLAVGTVVESRMSTAAAQALVYRAWWFSGLLGLLGGNVACAAAIRYPWKISQVGFVVTHAGLLLVLAGSILTQQVGVEGQVFLREGSLAISAAGIPLAVFLALTGSAGFTYLFYFAMRRIGALQVGAILATSAAFGVAIAVAFGFSVTALQALGGAVMALGVVALYRSPSAKG